MTHGIWTITTDRTTRIFSESASGAIEFSGMFFGEQTAAAVAEQADGLVARPVPFVDPLFADAVWRRMHGRSLRCVRYAVPESCSCEKWLIDFMRGFSPVAAAIDEGNWFAVGRLLCETSWWEGNPKLLKMLVKEDVLKAVIFLWACDFVPDADGPLGKLCTQTADPRAGWIEALAPLVGTLLAGQNAATFPAFARKHIAALLKSGVPLVVPLVGCRNYPFVDEIRTVVVKARNRAKILTLVEGGSLGDVEMRIGERIDNYDLRLIRDSGNPHDQNAVCAWVTDPATGLQNRVGYLRRNCAALLAPLLDEGLGITTKIACIAGHDDLRWFPVFAELTMCDDLCVMTS